MMAKPHLWIFLCAFLSNVGVAAGQDTARVTAEGKKNPSGPADSGEVCAAAEKRLRLEGQSDNLQALLKGDCAILYHKHWLQGTGKANPAICEPHGTRSAILDPKIYVTTRVEAAELTADLTFVDDAKERYLAALRRLTKSVLEEVAPKTAKDLNLPIKKGLGKVACPKDCNGNGVCTPNGCHCNEGFNGLDCSEQNPINP